MPPRHETRASIASPSHPAHWRLHYFPVGPHERHDGRGPVPEPPERESEAQEGARCEGDQAQADPRSIGEGEEAAKRATLAASSKLGGSAADKMAAPTAARLFAAEQRAAELEEESRELTRKLQKEHEKTAHFKNLCNCLLYTSPSPRDRQKSRMPSSA